MVLLYAVAPNLDKVVFDLYWGYPSKGIDYLDASALIFSGTNYLSVVDFSKRNRLEKAIRHSGDRMDDVNRRGHHIINIELQRIPAHVTNIFFTLSAWGSPTISAFKNPSLNFYEQSNPGKMLCTDQTCWTQAGNHNVFSHKARWPMVCRQQWRPLRWKCETL